MINIALCYFQFIADLINSALYWLLRVDKPNGFEVLLTIIINRFINRPSPT